MTLVSELDRPASGYTAPGFSADRYHQQLAGTRRHGWLARPPLAYVIVDRGSGEFFVRSGPTAVCAERANREGGDGERFDITAARDARQLTFGAGAHYCPGSSLAHAELEEALAFLAPRARAPALDGPPRLGGVEGIDGIGRLPIIWPGGSGPSRNDGPGPDG
jgi:hypothetical protein